MIYFLNVVYESKRIMMTQILDDIDAKKRFVASLTHTNKPLMTNMDDNFLKPVKTERVIKLTVIERTDEVQVDSTLNERMRSLQQIERILSVVKPRGSDSFGETNGIPEWAKLALASSNPNSKRKFDYY